MLIAEKQYTVIVPEVFIYVFYDVVVIWLNSSLNRYLGNLYKLDVRGCPSDNWVVDKLLVAFIVRDIYGH